jgi:hypothetical protein
MFETDNCTGTPYVKFDGAYAAFQISLISHTIYGREKMIPETRYINSHFDVNGSCVTQVWGSWPLVRAIEIMLPFSLPVALPLEFRF